MQISSILFIGNLFSSDMLLILVAALMLFGGDKLPEIARGIGKGLRDFKDASEGVKREINNQINMLEEKKTEEKLNEQAAQHHIASSNTYDSSYHSGVENTIPVLDNHQASSDDNTENKDSNLDQHNYTNNHVDASQHGHITEH